MNDKSFSEMESQPTPEMQKENPLNGPKHLGGKLGIVLCSALLGYTSTKP